METKDNIIVKEKVRAKVQVKWIGLDNLVYVSIDRLIIPNNNNIIKILMQTKEAHIKIINIVFLDFVIVILILLAIINSNNNEEDG